MLTIRLSRIGKKKKPAYRVIISEKTKDPYGNALEILGSYNPFSKDLSVDGDRVNYWLSKGAGMSPTINNLLLENKIIKGEKTVASKRGKKAVAAEKAAKVEASATAKAAREAAKKPTEEVKEAETESK